MFTRVFVCSRCLEKPTGVYSILLPTRWEFSHCTAALSSLRSFNGLKTLGVGSAGSQLRSPPGHPFGFSGENPGLEQTSASTSISCDDAMDGRTLNSGSRDSTLEWCGSGNPSQRPTSHLGSLWLIFRVYHPYLHGGLILPKDILIVRAGWNFSMRMLLCLGVRFPGIHCATSRRPHSRFLPQMPRIVGPHGTLSVVFPFPRGTCHRHLPTDR